MRPLILVAIVLVFVIVIAGLGGCSANQLYPDPEKLPEGAGAVHCIDYTATASSGLFSAGTFAGSGAGCICYYYGVQYEDVKVYTGEACGTGASGE